MIRTCKQLEKALREKNDMAIVVEKFEDKSIFIDTANLSTSDFNYLRGIKNNRMLDCQKKWRYII